MFLLPRTSKISDPEFQLVLDRLCFNALFKNHDFLIRYFNIILSTVFDGKFYQVTMRALKAHNELIITIWYLKVLFVQFSRNDQESINILPSIS